MTVGLAPDNQPAPWVTQACSGLLFPRTQATSPDSSGQNCVFTHLHPTPSSPTSGLAEPRAPGMPTILPVEAHQPALRGPASTLTWAVTRCSWSPNRTVHSFHLEFLGNSSLPVNHTLHLHFHALLVLYKTHFLRDFYTKVSFTKQAFSYNQLPDYFPCTTCSPIQSVYFLLLHLLSGHSLVSCLIGFFQEI